ncbi:glycosyltransferase family 39 protein [candidate division FCPU426 bacterium]|nr:glycosyltransferase family 39 protein [candidate division FCPU426 bacterium]
MAVAQSVQGPRIFWRQLIHPMAGVLGLALLVRIVYFLSVRNHIWFRLYYNDALNFYHWAISITQGDLLGHAVFTQSPLYAFWLAGIYSCLGGANNHGPQLLQFALGVLNCWLVYRLGRWHFSRAAGLIASAGAALYGMAVFYEGTLLSATVINTINLLLLWSAYAAVKKGVWQYWFICGCVLGLSAAARPNILPFALVLFFWLQTGWPGFSRAQKRGFMLAILGGVALVLSPVALRNALVLHEPVLSVGTGGLNFYIGNSSRSEGYLWSFGRTGLVAESIVEDFKAEAEQRLQQKLSYTESSRYWYGETWKEIRQAPGHWFWLLARKFFLFFNATEIAVNIDYKFIRRQTPVLRWPWLSFPLVVACGLLGMWLKRRNWRELLPLYGIIALYCLANVCWWVSSEYRFAAVPFFLIFAGAAIACLLEYVRRQSWRNISWWGLAAAVLLLLTHIELIPLATQKRWEAFAHYNLGSLYLRDKQWEQALPDLQEASEQLPDNALLSVQYGEALYKTKHYAAALAVLEAAFQKHPGQVQIMRSYAKLLTMQAKHEKAVALRKTLVEMMPQQAQEHYELGVTLLWAGQEQEANRAFAKTLEINPDWEARIDRVRREIAVRRTLNPSEN